MRHYLIHSGSVKSKNEPVVRYSDFHLAGQACSDPNNMLWLSVASAWEMQIKMALGKLTLNRPLAQTIADQQTTNGIQILAVELPHVLEL